jgi:short-subunit dehydrogenase
VAPVSLRPGRPHLVGASSWCWGPRAASGRACPGVRPPGRDRRLVARGEERLAAARQECVEEGAAASIALPADVLDQDRLHDVVDVVTSIYGSIDVVVHSANVMAYGRLEQVPPAVFERTVATAIHGTGVHVCTVAPGSVDTPIFRQAANFAGRSGRPPPPVASADAVARAVVRSADRPRRRRSVGLANGFIVLGYRLLPRVYDRLVDPLARLGAFARDTRAPTDGNVFAPLRPLVHNDQCPHAPRAGSGD